VLSAAPKAPAATNTPVARIAAENALLAHEVVAVGWKMWTYWDGAGRGLYLPWCTQLVLAKGSKRQFSWLGDIRNRTLELDFD
jgi:hypothetical protein